LKQGKHQYELWQILLSISFAAGSTAFLLYQIITTDYLSLQNFNDRTIGIAILTATDAARRTSLYIGVYAVAFLLFCVLLFTFIYLNEQYLKKIAIDFEKDLLFYLALFSIGALFLFSLSLQQVFLTEYKIFFILLLLVGIIIASHYYGFIRKKPIFCEIFSSPGIVIFSFVMPYCCIFIYWIFFNQAFLFSDIHLMLYVILWFFFMAGYYQIIAYCNRKSIDRTVINVSLIKSAIPLLIIPFCVPISNELQYTLSGIYPVTPDTISKIFVLALVVIAACIFWLSLRQQKGFVDTFSYIENFYFPLIIVSWGIFRYYQHFLEMGSYDIFHNGELLISPQQLFSFSNLPFIGNLPTHGFSEMSYQIFYSLVNGYTPVQPLIWNWIPVLIGMLLFYFFLSKMTTPLFAFLSIIFIPIFGIVDSSGFFYYSFCLFPIFTLIWLMKKPDFFRFSIHWLIILALFIWRIDFGAAACVGTIIIFTVILIRDYLHIKNTPLETLKNLITSFIVINGLAVLCYSLVLYLSGKPVLTTILVNIQFFNFQASLLAYQAIFSKFSFIVTLEYIILPIIALGLVLSFVWDQIVDNHRYREPQLILVFLALVTLALSIRSVQRHSLIEDYVSLFFPLLLILLPVSFEIKKKKTQYVAVLLLFFMYLIAFPAFAVLAPNENTQFFEYHTWAGKENRVIDNKTEYQNITGFIDTTLIKNETFFDFSNAPLIYVFTNKEFIPYLIPNLYQSSEIIQNDTIQRLDKKYQQNQVPIVIFKQGNWWDHVDDVPNEIRSYQITEYIYLHYRPIGFIDGKYQIWAADNIDEIRITQFEKQPGFTPITTISQSFDLQKLPYIWGTYDPLNAVSKTRILQNVSITPVAMKRGKTYSFSVNPDIDKSSGNYLYLIMKGSQQSLITIKYGKNDADNYTFLTEPTSKYENYLVRISTQWDWMNATVEKISITSSEDIELSEMNIRKGD
jgi:hypothetical protein